MRRSMAVAWLILASSQPSSAETLHMTGVFAAGAREASMLPTIGVAPFSGPNGDELGSAIERRLERLGEDGTPHPQLIVPSLRPDGLLEGATEVIVDDHPYVETRRRCVEKDKKDKCTKRETYEVRCIARTVGLRATMRLTRWRDRRTVYAATKVRDDRDEGCEAGGIVTPVASTLASMTESIAREVRFDLAPHRDDYKIRVREERAGLSGAGAQRFKAAVRLTKRDETAACRAFVTIGEQAPDHGPTLFNRGLCAEAAGRYAEASDLYLRARVFGTTFGSDVSRALTRVASLRDGAEDIERMGLHRSTCP